MKSLTYEAKREVYNAFAEARQEIALNYRGVSDPEKIEDRIGFEGAVSSLENLFYSLKLTDQEKIERLRSWFPHLQELDCYYQGEDRAEECVWRLMDLVEDLLAILED